MKKLKFLFFLLFVPFLSFGEELTLDELLDQVKKDRIQPFINAASIQNLTGYHWMSGHLKNGVFYPCDARVPIKFSNKADNIIKNLTDLEGTQYLELTANFYNDTTSNVKKVKLMNIHYVFKGIKGSCSLIKIEACF